MKLALLAATAALAYGAITADEVTSLPGWTGNGGKLLSRMWSGFLTVPGGKHMHYVFVASQNAPSKSPVSLWLNGGPGCSSMDGLLSEIGPYWLTPGANPSQLYANPWTWNKQANLLFLESPAGVGYSYADTPAGLVHNDTSTAADNLAALQAFYAGFPEFATNPLWIAGESYAGVYVPTLAYAVVESNAAGSSKIPLKGIMVGNGCTGTEVGVCGSGFLGNKYNIDQWRGHGLISAKLYASIYQACGDFSHYSPGCDNLLGQAAQQVGHINIYDIYTPCVNSGFPPAAEGASPEQAALAAAAAGLEHKHKIPANAVTAKLGMLGGPDECIDAGDETLFLNAPAVKQALHVDINIPWVVCSSNISYTPTEPNEPRDIYPTLIEKAGLRVLIYNGEADACVPFTDNEAWTRGMNYSVAQEWHPWMQDSNDVAGYATVYSPPGNGAFAFTTIRGAGHMVPQTQPEAAYQMFDRWINNKGF